MIGGVNEGMGFNYQYEICFQCHNTTINKTDLTSENELDTTFDGTGVYASNWNTIPNVESQFNTGNLAYHPLFAPGLHQPANSLNSNWDTEPERKDDTAPGGPFNGLDNNFVDGWRSTSLVTCSDCHGNGTTNGARGIHGSDYPWLNRRIETNVTVTTAGSGVLTPNVGGDVELYTASNFCVNCHRSDIYGFGSGNPTASLTGFARLDHGAGNAGYQLSCSKTNLESPATGGKNKIGCQNCHGGAEVAGIHGTNLADQGPGNRARGIRFMNGNSRGGVELGTDKKGNPSITCYTNPTPQPLGVTLSACGQHSNGSTEKAFNYDY
jgi:hypothetical protein